MKKNYVARFGSLRSFPIFMMVNIWERSAGIILFIEDNTKIQ